MASKGSRSKIDHETRSKRQKALEAPREPRRPKTHWDHVLEEMVWLSKDFEAERKWKMSQAKKVALKASKGMVDQATRGERKLKEEEQRLRKVALNIAKDVKKFWLKIEKLVLYKHHVELEARKQKARDKQLEFLLGQTERYSTMLAENLVNSNQPTQLCSAEAHHRLTSEEANDNTMDQIGEANIESRSDKLDNDEDYDIQSEDELEDDEHTLEEDEALISEKERQEELSALQNEMDIPLEELLKRYSPEKVSRESSPGEGEDGDKPIELEEDHQEGKLDHPSSGCKTDSGSSPSVLGRRCGKSNGVLSALENHVSEVEMSDAENLLEHTGESDKEELVYDFSNDEQEDGEFFLTTGEEKDDEATLDEEEELAKVDSNNPEDEIAMLQRESEIPIEELIAQYKRDIENAVSEDESDYASALSGELADSLSNETTDVKKQANATDCVQHREHELVVSSVTEQEAGVPEKPEELKDGEDRIADAAAAARSAQPTGITFSTTKVRTKFPFLLKFPLREYQHIGLDWLVTMYEKKLNGILADEMGLGKTIMTIALLAHLACEKGIWGPHLIVVPTSVMLNWETEFLKWCPAFKILTYFGSAKERKLKRQGWLKPNSFHICITTYRLVIQDSKVFKRKKWKYLILDEAHLIKNWKSQRWQTLLNFNSKRRILLTGTPLQNDLMELWSLMHFLMPHIFQSHQEFKDWFSNPITEMVEGQEKVNKEVVDRLHNVLRPFILRRLKRDVEQQLPMKHEHVIYCRLSKRQRNLYEEFISSSETQATLASANFFGMISVIMQLRKVCNHPDLFEGRPIISSYDMPGIDIQLSSSVCSIFSPGPFSTVDLMDLGYIFTHLDFSMTSWESVEVEAIATPISVIKEHHGLDIAKAGPGFKRRNNLQGTNIFEKIQNAVKEERLREAKEHAASIGWWNSLRCRKKPTYSTTLRELVTVRYPVDDILRQKAGRTCYLYSTKLADIVLSPVERFQRMRELVESFMFVIPPARTPSPLFWCSKSQTSVFLPVSYRERCSEVLLPLLSPIRPAIVRRQVYFPDRRLIQFDCGKLQELAVLLRKLKSEGHRALIFTQMTKMLDILEAFINLYGYTYMRLDGSTQPEERQTLMQRFNTNPKIFLFILSTRSGGVGINLVGADTVIFYDSDWNPAMDQQAQDRCHRIGQTREVHIYRLISESTIEENILKKANQKRALDNLVIQSGSYNTEFFKKLDPMELFTGHSKLTAKNMQKEKNLNNESEVSLSNADLEAALKHAEDEADYMALKKVEQEEAVDNQEFTEEAIGKLEDDELANEDDIKGDEPAELGGWMANSNKSGVATLNGADPKEEKAITLAGKDDDLDLLADVKQMAAAAAASGQAISSFEDHLRPLDRYAIRFLELWDPIIDKNAVHSEDNFEEKEWELDRIEKYKEEMEAEMDEDEEPLVYESWDADFATEAYRQHVEAAQHQLMEELEYQEKLKEAAANDNYNPQIHDMPRRKPKRKKKAKKTKFKSLKKRSLASQAIPVKEEPSLEIMSIDDDFTSSEDTTSDVASTHSALVKKRKNAECVVDSEDIKRLKKKSKKIRKVSLQRSHQEQVVGLASGLHDEPGEVRPSEAVTIDLEPKPPSRSKAGGKISITSMPVKRILMIKPEKTKKGNIWSKDCVPSPDTWLPQEDTVLSAVVHEYGPNWSLVSDALYGMTAGGSFRGRYRHPVHCCERFRELVQRYVLHSAENHNNEKVGSGKALLKVTEDNIRMLLDVTSELRDNELLLQKHFTALLSSAWRVSSQAERRRNFASLPNGFCSTGSSVAPINNFSLNTLREARGKTKFTNMGYSSKLVGAALCDASNNFQGEKFSSSNLGENVSPAPAAENMEITLEFQREVDDISGTFPSVVNLQIFGADPSPPASSAPGGDNHLRPSSDMIEHRFRDVARACIEGSVGLASCAFPVNDVKPRSSLKLQTLGKHKLSNSDSAKLSKSKSRKATSERNEVCHLMSEPAVQLTPLESLEDQHSGIELPIVAPPLISDIEAYDTDSNAYDTSTDLFKDSEISDRVPHDYIPDLISGLDDCSFLLEYTDIG